MNDAYVGLLDLFSSSNVAQVIKGGDKTLSEEESKKVGKNRLEIVFLEGLQHFAVDKNNSEDDFQKI